MILQEGVTMFVPVQIAALATVGIVFGTTLQIWSKD